MQKNVQKKPDLLPWGQFLFLPWAPPVRSPSRRSPSIHPWARSVQFGHLHLGQMSLVQGRAWPLQWGWEPTQAHELSKNQKVRLYFIQVWSLTQFYSADFSQSRISVVKCVFNKRTIKVCVQRFLTLFWDIHTYIDHICFFRKFRSEEISFFPIF